MTKLENLVLSHPKYSRLGTDVPFAERQRILDEITEEILSRLTPEDILSHSLEIYNETAEHYLAAPEHQNIIDELVLFMNLNELPSGSSIIDLGCGFGRDALFMSCPNPDFRKEQMKRVSNGKTTLERYPVPNKYFYVLGVDNCRKMIGSADDKKKRIRGNFYSSPLFAVYDIHRLDELSLFPVDGIWSCASLFTHTPMVLVPKILKFIKGILRSGGIFAVSYTQGFQECSYNKLLLSRTGRIKYFSQPMASAIENEARKFGLKLIYQSQDNFDREGKLVARNLFATQFFQKE